MKTRPSRREFLGVAAAGTAGSYIAHGASAQEAKDAAPAPKPPPIDAKLVRIAVIGLNGQGNSLARSFSGQPGARLDVLCDVDSAVVKKRQKEFADRGIETRTVGDPRQVFQDDSIDAVVIATPNHTHALLAVWALEAGKHVYVEKPVSQVLKEGRAIVDAAERSGLICQTGTHGRSSHAIRKAIEFVHSGGIGKVTCSRGLCYKPRRSIGTVEGPQHIPPTVDYDRWLGPVAYKPLDRRRLHYDWHWNLHTGNGDLGNQGIHQMDIARWALGEQGLPTRIRSIGGRLGYEDDADSPNTHIVVMDYASAPLVFEVRGLPKNKAEQGGKWRMDTLEGASIGNIVYGEKGMVRITNNYGKSVALDNDGMEIATWSGSGDHRRNFVEAVRANDPGMLNAEIIEGHLSSACCHLGLVSHQLGKETTVAQVNRSVKSDRYLAEAWGRMQKHLAANEVDLSATSVTLGRELTFDSKRERFTNDSEANQFLRRECREPFTFPGGLPA